MTDERPGVDERAEAYLDGDLSREETAAFERELASRPEVAAALSGAIVLRDLLGRMPPLEPPPGLEERIVGALALEPRGGLREGAEGDEPRSGLLGALGAARWLVRSPAAMFGGMGGARPVAAGLGQVRWVLGPLAPRRVDAAPRPAWRRVLGGLGRLGGLG